MAKKKAAISSPLPSSDLVDLYIKVSVPHWGLTPMWLFIIVCFQCCRNQVVDRRIVFHDQYQCLIHLNSPH